MRFIRIVWKNFIYAVVTMHTLKELHHFSSIYSPIFSHIVRNVFVLDKSWPSSNGKICAEIKTWIAGEGNQIHVRDTINLANKLRTEVYIPTTMHTAFYPTWGKEEHSSTECKSTYEISYIPFQDDPHHLSSPPTVVEELLPVCSVIAILTFLLHQRGTVIIYVMSAWLIAKAIEKHIHISSLLLYNPPSHSTSFFIVLCSYIM